jgi:GT2 family glycosyltransferase
MMVDAPCQIVHVELSERLHQLELRSDCLSGMIVFWWHDRPLGHILLVAGEFPLPPASVAARAAEAISPALGALIAPRSFATKLPNCDDGVLPLAPVDAELLKSPLEALAAPNDEGADRCARTSVIVCTRERPELLEACLSALAHLTYSPLEIIVVDNAPPKGMTSFQVVQKFGGVTYIRHSVGGLSCARNAGLAVARGEYVAFTDDDLIVHPRWLEAVVAGLAADGVGCVTGLVIPRELETDAQMTFEFMLGGFSAGYVPLIFGREFWRKTRRFGTPVWRIGAGASMAYRREVFAAVGDFDERLGAGASGCSEDSELWYRLLIAGWECRYEPAAVVFHQHRPQWELLEQQVRAYMRGHVSALLVQFIRTKDSGNLRRIFFTLPYMYGTRVVRAVLTRNWRHLRMDICALRGCLGGLRLRYLLLRDNGSTASHQVAKLT